MHEWHWVSAALCLLGMVLFAVTGITLNHAGQIEARPTVRQLKAQAPADVLGALQAAARAAGQGDGADQGAPALPPAVQDWARQALGVRLAGRSAEWSEDELYISMPRPGGDAWLRIDLQDGQAELEDTDRGWISYFNDLHKGRHAGAAWSWFIDIFAVAALIFSLTGLWLMKLHAASRPMTWPLTGLGVLLPLLLALLLVH